jgi:hypothetical protein
MLSYHRTWQGNLNKYSSKAQSQLARASIDAHIRDPTRIAKVPVAVAANPQQRAVYAGALPDTVMNVLSSCPSPEISMDFENEIHFQNVPHVETVDHDNQSVPVASHNSGKRKPDEVFVMNMQDGGQSKRKRSEKKCWKCGQNGCSGRGNKKNCSGKCQDCGMQHCIGRDSRHPSRSCATKLQSQS